MARLARCPTTKGGLTVEMDPLLEIALRAAEAGGEAVMCAYADPACEITHKDDKTPVTEADLASERIIVAMLTEAFPDIPVVSEETVPEAGFTCPTAARFWLIGFALNRMAWWAEPSPPWFRLHLQSVQSLRL